MLKYNQKQYNSENKNKQFIDYKTALTKLMQLPKEDILKRIQPILQDKKTILPQYLFGSEENRLQLLAG